MCLRLVRSTFWALAVAALSIPLGTARQTVAAESYRALHPGQYRVSRADDLFYNFYVGPAQYAGGAAGGMYPTPLPTPPLVGHTYITYQPLMPHEFLYRHHRTYHRHHPGHGWVTTKVVWW